MNDIIPFTFPETGQPVRTVTIDGEPWFVAKDSCDVVGNSKDRDALAQLDDDERVSAAVDTPGGSQQMTLVSEPGIYALMLISRSPKVKAFRRWITHEVIPSIRRTGSYSVAPRQLSNRELAQMVIAEADRADNAERRVAELEPAARAFEVIASAKGDFSLRDAAYILNRDPAIVTGQNRLMAHLRRLGMVDRKGVPYSKNAAHLTERIRTYDHPHTGEATLAKPQLRVTVAGLRYLHKKLGGVAPLRFEQLPLDGAA